MALIRPLKSVYLQVCVDILQEPHRSEVEFTCWDQVLACVDKLTQTFLGVEAPEAPAAPQQKRFSSGVSQLAGAVQATAYKRKRNELTQTTGDYAIEDSAPAPPAKALRPLPVAKPLEVSLVPKRTFDQRSVYSKLNTDENQGRNLILDMFLKSTQVFQNNSQSSTGEANYVLENHTEDPVKGNTTMSISVNVKRRRAGGGKSVDNLVESGGALIKRRSLEAPTRGLSKLCNKSVQTSQGRQAAQPKSFQGELMARLDLDDDYTIVANTGAQSSRFQMVRKDKEAALVINPPKMCRCQRGDANMFDFQAVDPGD